MRMTLWAYDNEAGTGEVIAHLDRAQDALALVTSEWPVWEIEAAIPGKGPESTPIMVNGELTPYGKMLKERTDED